jgi:hypothetical protein
MRSLTPASFPAGASRSFVTLLDGSFRMYYYASGTSIDVLSAISTNGLNWTLEAGVRYSDGSVGTTRATALPNGGYRLYFHSGVDGSAVFPPVSTRSGMRNRLMVEPGPSTATCSPATESTI